MKWMVSKTLLETTGITLWVCAECGEPTGHHAQRRGGPDDCLFCRCETTEIRTEVYVPSSALLATGESEES